MKRYAGEGAHEGAAGISFAPAGVNGGASGIDRTMASGPSCDPDASSKAAATPSLLPLALSGVVMMNSSVALAGREERGERMAGDAGRGPAPMANCGAAPPQLRLEGKWYGAGMKPQPPVLFNTTRARAARAALSDTPL